MDIKDFNIGQTVYILQMRRGRAQEPTIKKAIVKEIGRKYLTIENNNRYLSEEGFDFGLVENIDWGERSLLCLSIEDINMYIEKCELEKWLIGLSSIQTKEYTLEQLKLVKNVLSNNMN